ncbi:MAG: OmpA family protein [Bacteroidota bacterium]|nr:OmpA family protein [Candidatus Kapabacteria bacterium]MDW8221058.1 OmpA family protein [Bacteroidota bacterium]
MQVVRLIAVLPFALGVCIFILGGFQQSPQFDMRPGNKVVVKGNMFAAGSAMLKEGESSWLKDFAEYLVQRPYLYIHVTGYTDNQGDSVTNQRLSEARARSVRDILVKYGVNAERIKTFGKGAEAPVADNTTEEGRAANRRVEIIATSPFTERPLTSREGTPLPPEGRITALLPPVRSLSPWEANWNSARLGEPIYEYHRLETGAKARAEITFSNKHRIQIAERTQVIVYGQNASPLQGKPKEQLRLVQGGLWLNIKSVQQAEEMRIRTATGEFALDKTNAKIEIDSTEQALLSVHRGTVRLQSLQDSLHQEMRVPENFGIRMPAHAIPEKPRPLPPVPILLEPSADSLIAGAIVFVWRKMSPRIRFELDQTIVFDNPRYAAVTTQDSAHVYLGEGVWYVRLAGIDSIGLESKSRIYRLYVVNLPEPARFYVLTLFLFVGAVSVLWWGELTHQRCMRLWALGFVIAGCAAFALLHW